MRVLRLLAVCFVIAAGLTPLIRGAHGAATSPGLTLMPSAVSTGASSIAVNGTGFTAASTVALRLDTSTVVGHATVSATGAFSTSITLAFSGFGHHLLSATDTAGLTASQPLYVVAVNLTTSSAGPDTPVAINGRGFLPAEPISVRLGDQTVLSTTTDAAGAFSGAFTVPNGPFERLPLLVQNGAAPGLVFRSAFIITHATLKVMPATLTAGHTVAINAAGLPSRLAVLIKLDNRTLATERATPAGGVAMGSLLIPAGTAPGPHHLLVTDRGGHPLAGTTLTIVAPETIASSTPTPRPTETRTATPKPQLASSATRTATATETTQPSATRTPTATGTGRPSATATETARPSVTHTATATPSRQPSTTHTPTATATPTRTATPTSTATLPPTATPTATPHMTLVVVPSTVAAGDKISISGSGYLAGEQIDLQLRTGTTGLAALHLAYTAANGAGAFSVSGISIPSGTIAAQYRIVAVGLRSARSAEQAIAVTAPRPVLSVSPATVAPEDQIRVSGANFTPGERVSIFLSSSAGTASIPLGQAQADNAGRFGPISLRVPFGVSAGAVVVVAAGRSSNRLATVPLRINAISPTISVQPTAAVPGERITVRGSHFQPGETVRVDLVALASSAHLAIAQVDQSGGFSISNLLVPATTPQGTISIVATGSASRLSATTALAIRPLPANVRATHTTVRSGAAVGLNGGGFTPGETISVQLTGANLPALTLATLIAGVAGSFNLNSVTIPSFVPAGSYTLRAVGQVSGRIATVGMVVQAPPPAAPILSILGINRPAGAPYPVSPGSLVQVAGSNFPAGATVLITIAGPSGTIPLGALVANGSGALGPAGLTVPATAIPGAYTLQAMVNGQRVAAVGIQMRTLAPHIAISPTTLSPGATATVQGTGFAPGEQVVLALNGAALPTTPGAVLTNANGDFTATFVVPASVHTGANIVTAGGVSSRASTALAAQAELPVPTTWYFANGDTTGTNQTTISMLNTTGGPATVQMTFLYQAEPERHYTQIVPARSLATVDLALAAGAGRHIAVILQADRQISAQSTVTYGNGDNESAVGASGPSTAWYLAEGYTNGTFREYLEMVNPNTNYATIDLRLLPFNSRPAREVRFVMAPRSNIVVDAGQYMPGQSVAAVVTADKGVVVERTMRFGLGSRGAHDKIATVSPSTVWIFAQGESSGDRQTFFTILNPNQAAPAAVTATFFDLAGRPVGQQTVVVDPLHRGNIKLNDVLPNAQVATILTSNVPVVVERPEYEGPANLGLARSGSVIFGRNGGSLSWSFPGGGTANGDLTQFFLFNPNLNPVTIRATFYSPAGISVSQDITMRPNSVYVLQANGIPGLPVGTIGAHLQSTNGRVFIAEERVLNSTTQRSSSTQGVAQ